jgi:hypothetical protein
MACVAAAHATWIPKEAEAAPASFSLQLRSRLDGERLRHAHRDEKPDTAYGRAAAELRLRVQLSSHEGAPCRCKDRAQRREGAWDTVEHCAAIR